MRHLLDTGVLLRLVSPVDPLHETVRAAVQKLCDTGWQPCCAVQNIAEFWNVTTRPSDARNGLGLPPSEAKRRLETLRQLVEVLVESEASFAVWLGYLLDPGVRGVQVHDARLAGVMVAHGVQRILTLNPGDFARYPSIVAVTPESVLTVDVPGVAE